MQRRPAWRRFVRTLVRVAVVLAIGVPVLVVTAGLSGGYLVLFGDLPGTVPEPRPPLQAIPSKIFDANGQLLGEFRQFDLTIPMNKADVPQVLKDAVVAAEDQNFWNHQGMDPRGLARAAYENYRSDKVLQGGSTITQQYVRARYLNTERTVERKLNEIILATRVERDLVEEFKGQGMSDEEADHAMKEEILFRYLSETYFGGGAYGAGAAAQTYFRKDVKDLTAAEAATLAAVIPAPSRYGPRDNPQQAEARRKEVLSSMAQLKRPCTDNPKKLCDMLTPEQYEKALAEKLWWHEFGPPPGPATVFYPPPATTTPKYPYFVDYVRRYLLEKYGPDKVYKGGLIIETTLDPHLQQLAEDAVAQSLAGTDPPLEMSLVTVEPSTGFVKALVGGRDWNQSQVNLALGGITGMQPGSAFKAFTLAKALEDGYGPDTTYVAPAVINIGGYRVKGGAGAAVDLRYATANSTNTYFVQLARDLGPNRIAELANRVGVSRIRLDHDYNLSLTLGSYEVSPLDMAAGFAVFANHGVKADVTPVKKVTEANGNVLEDNTVPRGKRVLAPAVADWTTELLTGTVRFGTGRRARIGRPAAGKTGTAENYTAAWFVGYTPQLSTAVWTGYADSPKPLCCFGGFGGPIMGGTVPAATWARFMQAAHEGLPVVEFAKPGVLPLPTSGLRKADPEAFPPLTPDCGGPCVNVPILTTPTTEPPPDENAPKEEVETTTTTRPRRVGGGIGGGSGSGTVGGP
ncbi:MAG: transglycosylase domain-containing protein [Acidimicrobiales bacterium]|nr:transglycosylase domain-containing protein [Acidimicrobiales bacterium]